MDSFNFDVNRQLTLMMGLSALSSIFNVFIMLGSGVPYLPLFYICSALFFLTGAKWFSLDRFIFGYCACFLQIICQAVLSIYIIGDDCGIQLYLLMLILPCNYIRMTDHSPAFQNGFIFCSCGINILCYIFFDEFLDFIIHPLRYLNEESEIFFTLVNVLCSFGLLSLISGFFCVGYQKRHQKVLVHSRQLEKKAESDPLTGLINRRGIEHLLKKEYSGWKTGEHPLTISIGDLDHFKEINDQYGHDAGDEVLKQTARLLSESLRKDSAVCRWGGEEFLFLFPNSLLEATAALERIRLRLESTPVRYQNKMIHLTMTFGVASTRDGYSIDDIIRCADARLYLGKQNGRNQVVTGQDTEIHSR